MSHANIMLQMYNNFTYTFHYFVSRGGGDPKLFLVASL